MWITREMEADYNRCIFEEKKNKKDKTARGQAYKLSNQPTHSARPQAKGPSFKPEATSSKILEPGYKRTSLGSGAQATRTNEFFG